MEMNAGACMGAGYHFLVTNTKMVITLIAKLPLQAEADKLKHAREDTAEEFQRLKIAEQELDQVSKNMNFSVFDYM